MSDTGSGAPGNPLADPAVDIQLAVAAFDAVSSIFKRIAAQHGLTTEQILAHAEQMQTENVDALKALLES